MKRGLSFDPTINAGHLLTFAGFLLAGFAGWTTLDKRVVVLEEGRKGQEQVDRHQDLTNRETMAQIRESLTEIKRNVEKLNDRLERR